MSKTYVELRCTNSEILISGMIVGTKVFQVTVLPHENLYAVLDTLFGDGLGTFETHYLYPLYLIGEAARTSGPTRVRINVVYD